MSSCGAARLRAALGCALAAVAWLGAQELDTTGATPAPEAPQPRLLDRTPTDLIRLRSGESMRIVPLPQRKLPANTRPGDVLTVELPDFPGEKFEVAWRNIAELKLFEQQLLDEAQRLTSAGQRDEAFEYYQALRARYPDLEGLRPAVNDFLAAEAESSMKADAPDRALSILLEIRETNSDYPGLSDRVGAATDQLVQRYLQADDLTTARSFLARLTELYPEHAVAARWQADFEARCRADLDRSAQLRASDDLPGALVAAQAALRLLPTSAEAQSRVAELTLAAGWASVAVSSPAQSEEPAALDDWAARRVSRLLAPGLYELAEYSREGGRYTTRFGEGTPNELDFQLTLTLRPDLRLPDGGAALTGRDVAQRLIERAEIGRPDFRANWAQVFQSVAVRDVFQLDIRFRQSGLRPEALLQFPIAPEAAPSSAQELASTYAATCRVTKRTPELLELTRFNALPAPTSPRRVTERVMADPQLALEALTRGEVALIDRVAPWLTARLARDARLAVEPYAVPTLCVLIPNAKRTLAANRTFRRALQYGIYRQNILESQLVRGPLAEGTQVVSGPFPADSYGAATDIPPRDYEPYLAKTLLEVSITQMAAQLPPRKDGEPIQLVLSHPPHESARVACHAIKRQLDRLGLSIALVEQEPSAARAKPDYDFRYAELFVAEPAIDAFRLFGPGGLVPGTSPYLLRAVRQLSFATDWPAARRTLQQIHRLVHEELAVIPLWQIREHLARDRRVEGVGQQPIDLYSRFDAWQVGPWSPVAQR